jgi:hypothetical protein
MRREKLYLTDIVEAADSIHNFLQGVSRERFIGNDLLRSAVLQKLPSSAKPPRDCRRNFAHATRQSNGRTSSPSATSPFMLTSPWTGPSSGLRQLRTFPS